MTSEEVEKFNSDMSRKTKAVPKHLLSLSLTLFNCHNCE